MSLNPKTTRATIFHPAISRGIIQKTNKSTALFLMSTQFCALAMCVLPEFQSNLLKWHNWPQAIVLLCSSNPNLQEQCRMPCQLWMCPRRPKSQISIYQKCPVVILRAYLRWWCEKERKMGISIHQDNPSKSRMSICSKSRLAKNHLRL